MENRNMTRASEIPEAEVIRLTSDDISLMPKRFNIDGKSAPLATGYVWCTFQDDPDLPPIHFLRSFDKDKFKSGGIIRLGDSPVHPHTVLEYNKEMYKVGDSVEYTKVKGVSSGLNNDNTIYEQRISNPRLLHQYSTKQARIVEADVLDLTYDYLPYALVVHGSGALGVPYMQQCAIINGTYKGKKVSFLGGWDRMFRSTVMQATYGQLFAGIVFIGITPDGCREWGSVMMFGSRGFGYYCKDNEEPVVSTDVKMENATWEPLSYLDDGTVTFTKATFRLANKEIHYDAKWGYRGWDEESILSLRKNGYSLSSGSWYEGFTPYKHEKTFTFAESHEAYQNKV